MKCWYCYEEHRPEQGMNKKVFNTVVKLFQNKISDTKLKQFNLAFFGGEPLLEFDTIVMPLIYKAEQLCSTNGKNLHISFVTNSLLLDKVKIEKLSKVKTIAPICFQITLDGDERYHNATKKVVNILIHTRQHLQI